jgi:hypothetical protein
MVAGPGKLVATAFVGLIGIDSIVTKVPKIAFLGLYFAGSFRIIRPIRLLWWAGFGANGNHWPHPSVTICTTS